MDTDRAKTIDGYINLTVAKSLEFATEYRLAMTLNNASLQDKLKKDYIADIEKLKEAAIKMLA